MLFTFFLLGCSGGETPKTEESNNISNQSQGLTYLRSIPSDLSDNYMGNPFNMVFDGQNSFYVSGHYESKVFEFSLSGELVNTIGGEGKGPGEFNNQLGVDLMGKNLVVMDQGNLRVQVFDSQGIPVHTFLTKDVFSDFEIHNDTLYTFSINAFRQLDESHHQNLIKVFDMNGNRLFSFGNYLFYGEEGMTEVASYSKMRIHNGKLYVLYMYFPLMQVYDLRGRLLDEVIFDKEKLNLLAGGKNDPQTAQKGNRIEMESQYKTFWVDDSGIYLGMAKDYLHIDHHTWEGEYVRSYIWKGTSNSYYMIDVWITAQGNGDLKLFLLNNDEYPLIHVFKMETD